MRIRPSPRLVHAVGWGLTSTLRIHRFGLDNIRRALHESPHGSAIFAHFHQSLLMVLVPHHHLPIATLASHSRDGAIIADYLSSIGLRPVRGSSSRGGADGARELIRCLHERTSIVLNVDGPRGPFKEAKSGVPVIAQRHGVPVVPIAARASMEISLKGSWDRFRIPLPLSHLAVVYGEPLWFPEATTDAERLEQRQRLTKALHVVESRATALVGKNDGLPPEPYLDWLLASGSPETPVA
jgi:lysophospholipid acyltransferase (LPLAT)-like uncharacterized protein